MNRLYEKSASKLYSKRVMISLFFCFWTLFGFCQPPNDNCATAGDIIISNGGYGLGPFTSGIEDISSATVEAGEGFAPAILVAGQNQKSMWYRFTVPTSRRIRVTLAQNGSAITAGDVGFSVYKANVCTPVNAQISSKLTPLAVFGNTFHPCVDSGIYYIQVSGKASANGPVYVIVETAATGATYDMQTDAYEFGTIAAPDFVKYVDYQVECQSVESATEVCSSLANYQQYSKTTWHTFTTPAYFDHLAIWLSCNTGNYFNGISANQVFGYNLYSGDGKTLPLSSLSLVDGCDSFVTNGYYPDKKIYKCGELQPNTTYTIQLFFNDDFVSPVRVAVSFEGTAPTQAPEPILSFVPASNQLGVLPADANGIVTYGYDQFGCNAYHSLHPCNPSLPAGGIPFNGENYNLSTFFTFTLATSATITISSEYSWPPYRHYNHPLLMRLYAQGLTNSCNSLDTNNLYMSPFLSNSGSINCIPPGTYTLQVSGTDTLYPKEYFNYSYVTYPGYVMGVLNDLGKKFYVAINVAERQQSNNFSLNVTGAFDTLNNVAGVMQPLTPAVTYQAQPDTLGCTNTVLPADTTCDPNNTKASYREFNVADSGIVTFSYSGGYYMKIYKGDANSLATAQGVFSYPQRINGLSTYTSCIYNIDYCTDGDKVCVTPGNYTFTVFGLASQVGTVNTTSARFDTTRTIHNSLAKAEDMGDILSQLPAGGSVSSALDYYDCKDNAIAINGYQPCLINAKPATKAIYRQFYLSAAAIVRIAGTHYGGTYCFAHSSGPLALFSGRATDGMAGLSVMSAPWQCFEDANTGGNAPCSYNYLPAGWYTVVSYGSGPAYDNPLRDLSEYFYSSYVGHTSRISIEITIPTSCPGPLYNRPYKAAIDTNTNQPFLIEWGPRVGHTAAYPKTDTTYTLPTENFNCTNDTPFISHPILVCDSVANPPLTKVAYWVFRLTQESYVQVNTGGLWGAVYAGNARADSLSFANTAPIHPCLAGLGHIQLCKMQPGVYTLVVFAPSSYTCNTIAPTIYIDMVGYSRFDHAANAYDFGVIPPDSVFYDGKPLDTNPLDPGRAASNDFFYCTTGSQFIDPTQSACSVDYLPSVYNTQLNNPMYNTTTYAGAYWQVPRRNLWYTFVADKGGYVRVKVKNKILGKTKQNAFAIYKSNVDGTIPFSTVVATGQVDSTIDQGLTLIGTSLIFGYCYSTDELSFYRDPCTSIPERYYVVVDIAGGYPYPGPPEMPPNHQVEVSVLMDSVNFPSPKFDHYYQASNIGSNLGSGTYTGATDNFSCATKDATDPINYYNSCAQKTLWYKFSTTVSGTIRYRVNIYNSYQYGSGHDQVQLLREIIPGDSTLNGLQFLQNVSGVYDNIANTYWYETCVSPGTYYLILTGCNRVNEYVFTEIQVIEQAGDYCGKPVLAPLSGAGVTIASVLVNCHTIGTDYGEFNPTLTCPNGAVTTQYKTSWFRIDITGSDTLDVTTFLTETTNASSSEIKYRLMNGDCGAMQERSCVQDALTQDTYKCLAPGSYWVQVFTPVINTIGQPVTGNIELNLSSVVHADTCAPLQTCFANAYYQTQFDCAVDEVVRFINYSTFGSSITYTWDFGYNGQTSTAVSPQFEYPALTTSQKYYITLSVTNTSCGGTATYRDSITIQPRPDVYLGPDTSLCNGGTVLLHATSHTGSTYLWDYGGSTDSLYTVSEAGIRNYSVTVTYNGCIARDTVRVNIDTVTSYHSYLSLCGGDPAILNSSRGLGESYLWSNGTSGSSISVYTAGEYWCDVSLNGCTSRDSFTVSLTAVVLGSDRAVCFGTVPVVLDATTSAATYTWQDGSANAIFTASSPGLYWVDIVFGNCTLRDTVILSNLQPQTSTSNAAICQGLSYTLPSGTSVSNPGIYNDTLRTTGGCDSIINTINLSLQAVSITNSNAFVCPAQPYTLPWGIIVTAAGTYSDTLRYGNSGCDSVIRSVTLATQTATSANITAAICQGSTYPLASGQTVSITGIYSDTLYYAATGCDSAIRVIDLTVQSAAVLVIDTIVCAGQNIVLPSGGTVSTTGSYADTLHYTGTGCDSLRVTVNLTVQTKDSLINYVSVCAGQSYLLPSGLTVSASGTYRDTLYHTATSCDSLYNIVNLSVLSAAQTDSAGIVICTGQNYTLPSGQVVNSNGIYRDTLYYAASGCDSLYRIVNLTVQPVFTFTDNPVICDGATYTLPWGQIVNTAGVYADTTRYATGCDSLYSSINLSILPVAVVTNDTVICAGGSYTLPWGLMVTTSGIYRDTLRYANSGCDSFYNVVDVIVLPSPVVSYTNQVICATQTYTLPWGPVVSAPGEYADTVSYANGCDSLYQTVNLIVQSATTITLNPVICEGSTYTLPSGNIVNTSGQYNDTLYYTTGCDSVYRTVDLVVQPVLLSSVIASICDGQTYTLPWGLVVNASGVYSDTIRYAASGCDSLRSTLALTVQTAAATINNAVICDGQSYVLPWGQAVTAAGTYTDTLRYFNTGCDSLIRIINLSVQQSVTNTQNVYVCEGQTYTLPWGQVVANAGSYTDTLHYISTGCDSVIRIVNLTVKTVSISSSSQIICSGQTYLLPWGQVAAAAGTYADTLHYSNTTCDSAITSVNLVVQQPIDSAINAIVCNGQVYTLPWGAVVNTAGTYRDTLHYSATGCDSMRLTVNLTVQALVSTMVDTSICDGQTYTMPWGQVVTATGTYTDTLQYSNTGCDSLARTINLTVQAASVSVINAVVCSGQSYTLPWGMVVNSSGTYHDTLYYTNTGCDSVRRRVNLVVQPVVSASATVIICDGQTYTLPWGPVVSAPGIYLDTARYANTGCDSVIRIVDVSVQVAAESLEVAVVCSGQSYSLPWGQVVTTTGIYKDTLQYINTGCDSVHRTVSLTVQPALTQNASPVICAGQTYTLPWGQLVNTTGTYRDTLRYAGTGCDSLYRIVDLLVISLATSIADTIVCENDLYLLPWGVTATTSGTYTNMLKSAGGCDSLQRTVNLTIASKPVVSVTKSNDINCSLGFATLNASGGESYLWSPSGSLSDGLSSNPVATPSATTLYTVQVKGSNGCNSIASIEIVVQRNDGNGFQLPSAFSPNGDGLNDCFGVKSWGSISNLRLDVFNRWGQLVFSTSNPGNCWDGKFKGMEQPIGAFMYYVSANTICGPVMRKGTVMLIR